MKINIKNKNRESKLIMFTDFSGIAISGVCMIHCMAMPLISVLIPMFSHYDHVFHDFVIIVSTILAGVSWWSGYKNSKDLKAGIWFTSGILVLIYASVFLHDVKPMAIPILAFLLAGILMMAGHWTSHRMRHKAEGEESCKM